MTQERVTKDSAKIVLAQITEFPKEYDEENQHRNFEDPKTEMQEPDERKLLVESELVKEFHDLDSDKHYDFINNLMRHSTLTLKIHQNTLEQTSFSLKAQDKTLFETCMKALKQNNKEEATKCATEIYELRKRIKLIFNVRLAIERVILRIEEHVCTVNTYSHIVPAVKSLRSISNEIAQILPNVSEDLKSVCRMLLAVAPENPVESK